MTKESPSSVTKLQSEAVALPQHRPSCDLYRRRKVKCDRQQPCSICIQGKSDCVYPSRRGRAPKRSRHAVDAQLADRLSQLETLIKRFGNERAAASEQRDCEVTLPTTRLRQLRIPQSLS
jgi:hypothetical protein